VKLTVTVSGQDPRRLVERIEELVRQRAATTVQPSADPDLSPTPPRSDPRRPRRSDRRS